MDLSVVVVSWNTREVLRDCLTSIYRETRDITFEVLVVDNGSQDGTLEMLEADFPRVRVIANDSNRGFAAANNQGISLAEGRFVLLLNSDTVILDGALQKTLECAREHPTVGVLGCRLLNADRTVQPSCFQAPSISNLLLTLFHLATFLPRHRMFGKERMTWWSFDGTREVEVVVGAFMLVRREAIDLVGGMDERFFMYGEEVDWCMRMRAAGWRILFTDLGEVVHLGGASAAKVGNAMFLQNHGSVLLLVRKHRGRLYSAAYFALTIVLFGVRSLEWAATGLLRGSQQRPVAIQRSKLFANALIRLSLGGPEALCVRPTFSIGADSAKS